MKNGLRLLAFGLVASSFFVGSWVNAQEETAGKTPTFSPAEIGAAFETCRAYAREAAEMRRKFPMKYGLNGASPGEQLEACVLAVLQEDIVEPIPLG